MTNLNEGPPRFAEVCTRLDEETSSIFAQDLRSRIILLRDNDVRYQGVTLSDYCVDLPPAALAVVQLALVEPETFNQLQRELFVQSLNNPDDFESAQHFIALTRVKMLAEVADENYQGPIVPEPGPLNEQILLLFSSSAVDLSVAVTTDFDRQKELYPGGDYPFEEEDLEQKIQILYRNHLARRLNPPKQGNLVPIYRVNDMNQPPQPPHSTFV